MTGNAAYPSDPFRNSKNGIFAKNINEYGTLP